MNIPSSDPDKPATSADPSPGSAACATACPTGSCPFTSVIRRNRATPYIIGALIGILSWVTFLTMDKALGTSTTMVHVSGLAVGMVAPDHVVGPDANAYYASEINPDKGKNMFDWQLFLVVGLVGGAYLGSLIGKDRQVEHVPALWAWRFGASRWVRYAAAFVGGVILLFGARMAGGCTSGHGISGGLQLALSSWSFFIAMFVSGVVTAFALFGREGRSHVDL